MLNSSITSGQLNLPGISSGNVTLNSSSTSGQLLTINGSSTPTWISAAIPSSTCALTVSGNSTFKDNVEIGGNLTISGVNIGDRFDKIEERLNILRPNVELESRWDELKELGERYRALEQELLSIENVIDILKS
jgi:hypothetical protein